IYLQILQTTQPLIVYFPDFFIWLSRAVLKSNRKEFIHKMLEMFDQLSGSAVLICGHNIKVESGSKEKEKFTMILPNFGRLAKLKISLEHLTNRLAEAEKIVGWAKNHYLSSCVCPSIENERLVLPRESLEVAILRWKDHERSLRKPSQNLKNMAKDEYESNFVSAVVPPGEIGVRFNDVGALEDVKKALNELVILPMRRPELFTHGNLLRPCKGILLFGPPGTGKTLLAKALATEAGANFMSITGSTLTSKWFGDAEKLTKALFSFASKLAPVIIFVDEVDSLLGARGGSNEHEATRRMRNEFMAAWDGLRSKDSQRIIILGATNRPFDLDDAVIRRLPRRIYVDLPDASNRMKILKIILQNENLQSDFHFEELANATDGYSGSDLKNLCIAAAYRPVQEVLEKESKEKKDDYVEGSSLRPLTLDDFIQAKAKVGPSVSFDAASMNELRKWNEQYGEGGSRRKSPFGF
ncbi:Outer mitochondrial transmembrane helix translocase, partial [Linum perenne]